MPESTRARAEDLELLKWAYTLTDAARRHPLLGDAAMAIVIVTVFTLATAWTLPWWALLWSGAYVLAYVLRTVSLPLMLGVLTALGVAQVAFTEIVVAGNFLIPLAVYQAAANGRRRTRLAALALLLGASVLAAVDFAPTAVAAVAMVFIYSTGLLVPWVLVRALDLTGLTGGRQQPSLSLDPLVIGTVLGAVILTVLLAITVSAWLAGRANLAQALRVGEER